MPVIKQSVSARELSSQPVTDGSVGAISNRLSCRGACALRGQTKAQVINITRAA